MQDIIKKLTQNPGSLTLTLVIGLLVSNLIVVTHSLVLSSKLKNAHTNIVKLSKELEEVKVAYQATSLELDILKGNVAIIDGAINAENKRKQRIIKVRDVIYTTVKSDNLEAAQKLEPSQLAEMATAIVDRADAEHIPVALLMGLIRQESAFNPEAVSRSGAQGLTQVLPSTAEDIKQWTQRYYYEPFRISHNVQFGAYYLGRMLRRFQWDQSKALMAYNGGPQAVELYVSENRSLWPETIDYEQKVMAFKRKFQAMGAM